ncbi:lipopolysaccharide assembly protein LapB [Massilia sp. erpn]|uniref:tetratricopeptide repeat protein n=1 Tax=Massilia sp. erpn TaxID=2738142 RepID=UPI002107ED44|nr:tetratricopeptide repeat protein [Massilia sp. erpn]
MLVACSLHAMVAVAASPQVDAVLFGSGQVETLVSEAHGLTAQGRFQEAARRLEQARQLAPQASGPLSALAHTIYTASLDADSADVPKLRAQAESLARAALERFGGDPLAQEILRRLAGESERTAYKPKPEAAQAFTDGEVLFHARKMDEARAKYREAQRADPGFADAWLMEGDAYFVEKNWAAAELLFRKAAETDPLHPQAWRFLADALVHLGDRQGAEAALYKAVEAVPNQRQSWDRLAALFSRSDRPLMPLHMARGASVDFDDKTGKSEVTMASEFSRTTPGSDIDHATWLAYAFKRVNMLAAAHKAGGKPRPFALELASWKAALATAENGDGGDQAKRLSRPDLRQLQAIQGAGQLQAAIFVLMFSEAYRSEFEAWKTANPGAVRRFIEQFRLMP